MYFEAWGLFRKILPPPPPALCWGLGMHCTLQDYANLPLTLPVPSHRAALGPQPSEAN